MKPRTAPTAPSVRSRTQATARVVATQRQTTPALHRVAPARAYRTVTGKWEAPAGGPRSGSA
jgi:hypothetical protein